jgi:hypothetical protein
MVNTGYSPSLDRSQPVFKPFPPVQDVVKLVEVDKPGQQFRRLVDFLLDAGIFSSEQILLCPEDVLCVIGDMGLAQARILRNYAKRMVLPVLGLQGNYEEPDLTIYQPGIRKTNQTTTHEKEEEILGVVMCLARLKAVSRAKPGPFRPGQAGPLVTAQYWLWPGSR